MKIRPVLIITALCVTAGLAEAKKQPEAKEYTEGRMLGSSREQVAGGVLSSMQGSGSEIRYTYVIESKDGQYEARESYSSTGLFRPLSAPNGTTILFRVNSKGRLLYVPLEKGEKTLEVVRFTPKTGE